MEKNITKHVNNNLSTFQQQQSNKKKKLKILKFTIQAQSFFSLNDYSFYQSEEQLIASPITDLIYFSISNESYIISANNSNKILIASFSSKIIKKITIPLSRNSNKTQILTTIKEITNSNNEFKLVTGTSNGLIFFYTVLKCELNFIAAELQGVFSVFQNKFFKCNEAYENAFAFITQKNMLLEPHGKQTEISLEEFICKNNAKETQPINAIEIKENILYAGLNSFVFKFNLRLNLLTQVMPALAAVNRILVENGNVYFAVNCRSLVLFESTGVLVSRIDTSLFCVFNVERIEIKNRNVIIFF